MVEGSLSSPYLIRPVLLFTAGLAVDLAAVERIVASLGATVYSGFEDIRFSVPPRSFCNGRLQNAQLIGQSVRCNWRGQLKL
jgi:hypothetical protein